MLPPDREEFFKTLEGVHDFYGKELSRWALEVWWNSMKNYDLAAIRDAFGRHCVNPDTGQWLPKPADVVKMLGGSSLDSAMLAWSKVDQAVRHIGTYETVAFDDPLIHRVLEDMGGWIKLGMAQEKEWPFIQKEFETRYRGYRQRSEIPQHQKSLIGQADAYNIRHGFKAGEVRLIGDHRKALAVLNGADVQLLVGAA